MQVYLQVHEKIFRHGGHFHLFNSVLQNFHIWNISFDLVHPDVAGLLKKNVKCVKRKLEF